MKKLHLLLLTIVASALSSCMTIDSLITVEPDGSGTVVDKVVLKAAAKQMFKQMSGGEDAGEDAGDATAEMLDEEQYKERAKQLGAEFVGVKKVAGDDDGVEVTYKFSDITKVKFTPFEGGMGGGMGGLGEDEEEEETEPVRFEFTPGSPATVKVKLPKDFHDLKSGAEGAGGGGEDEVGPEMMAMMAPMFKDMKMRVRMRFGKEIVKTNATVSQGNNVILMFVDFGKVVAAPGGLKKMMEMDGKDRESINKTPGIKMELKDEFDVTFK
jgi:hypothetical protein